MNESYKKQVSLLLDALPEVAREEDLALHGGTAINLFVRDMPRLSVDIDLTYVPIAERAESFSLINEALRSIEKRLKALMKRSVIRLHQKQLKLQIAYQGAQIKIEVNQINRGCLSGPITHTLCDKAQEELDAFCEIKVVPDAQLFGGKTIAALDRQHPRDLFDTKYLLEENHINDENKPGIILCLLSSNRPIYEILSPSRTNQRQAFENQFKGMSDEPFSYDDFEETREKLIIRINELLNNEDKQFLINFKKLSPEWDLYDFKNFPAVQWKMKNLEVFKEKNEDGYYEAVRRLADFFE